MLTLKKQNNGDYNIALQKPIELLDKDVARKIKKEIKRLLHKNRVLNINLDYVEDFAGSGYKILGDMLKMAEKKECVVNLIVGGTNIVSKVKSINELPIIK